VSPVRRLAAVPLLLAFAACGAGEDPALADGGRLRVGRFGSLRDFVLVDRAGSHPRDVLFVDRFEVTQGDWYQFTQTRQGRAVDAERVRVSNDPALPVGGVTLPQARAFASWRLARLPRVDEWQAVAVGDGRSRFPWGSKQDPTKANTGDLALGQTTPVGTFESGRRAGADAPYDLVGNVREWTESVPASWWERGLDLPRSFRRAQQRARLTPALQPWQGFGGLMPLGAVVAAGGLDTPRVVVGSDYETPMVELYGEQRGREWRQRTGLRLYATAGELLDRLLAMHEPIDAEGRALVQRFLSRDRHRDVLLRALEPEQMLAEVPKGSVADWVLRALQRGPGGAR